MTRWFVLLVVVIALAVGAAPAQITITATDVSTQLAVGHTITTRIDTATKNVDIGALGATSWDFSGIATNYSSVSLSVRPDTTAFFADFPSATHALKIGGIYSYMALGGDLLTLGTGFSTPFVGRVIDHPAALTYDLPLTMGASWTSSYAETTRITSPSITTVTDVVAQNSVDAYGNLTLPGGAVYAALRLKTDLRKGAGVSAVRLILYQYLTTSGATVTVTVADTTQPSTGVVAVSSTSWNAPIATSVEEFTPTAVPREFVLEQNYPNPFNPSTLIRYGVPSEARVRLAVYDLLGNRVAVLVDGRSPAGFHEVSWDASRVASGVYYCRLEVPGDAPGDAPAMKVMRMAFVR